MTGNASEFVGNIPENYDRELGPNIFEGYAADIALRAQALKPSRVLELAAGTGIVSRKLRTALAADVKLFVTDLNAPMLDVARGKFRQDEKVEFRTADAMKLDFLDAEFDLIVCQFGVMFFPDKVASFREALRVLKPGGTYLFNVWGTRADNPFADIVHETVAELFPNNPPGFYRVPFSYADDAVVTADLRAAGFRQVEHEAVRLKKRVNDLAAFAHGLVNGNPMIDEIRQRGTVDADAVVRTIERRFRDAWGADAVMPLKAIVFTAQRS
jgi:ubiquinone/menaquinone biosynthesis C-methylase UbiE